MSTATPRPAPSSETAHDATFAENAALLLAASGIVVGAIVGLLMLGGTRPLSGRDSIGAVAGVAAMGTSGIAFVIAGATLMLRSQPWMREIGRFRRWLNILGLAALHAVFSVLLTTVLFAVFANAFRGLALDPWAGTFWVAAACGVCTYICVVSASEMTTQSLAVLLAAFIATGVMASAFTAPDPHWWQHHFSFLGSVGGESGITFNLTLLLAGLALVTIGDFLAHDLGVWAAATGLAPWRAVYVRVCMVVLGVLLVAVGLIPVDVDKDLHDAAAQSMIVVFAAALVAFPILFRRLPGAFQVATLVIIGLLITCLVLWKGVGYLNTTAFELGAASTVLVWLLLFIRSVTAAVRGVERSPAQPSAEVAAYRLEPVEGLAEQSG